MIPSLSSVITGLAARDPDRVLVIDDGGCLTAAELEESATRLAHALRASGVEPDDLVTVSLPNGRDVVIACAAIWKAGATPQPVSPMLTESERRAVEAVARPAAAFGRRPATAGIAWFDTVDAPAHEHPLPDLAASSWKAPTTSGSTGAPKVVRAAGPARLDPARQVALFLPLAATQLVAGPMTHSAPFTYAFRGLMTGHRLVILPRFDERRWLDAVEQHAVTWTLVVPTMMHRLLRLPARERAPERLRSLQTVLHLGAPCAPELKRAFMEWLGPERLTEVYAGSESNGLTAIRGDEWLQHPGSVGRPIGGTELEVRTPGGGPVGPGEVGIVWMRRGEHPAYEYLGAESRRDAHGWDTLGDLGRLDAEGYLYLVDRADDVINRGGEKIHPVEVERVLEQHPAVRSAVAFGSPHESLGQQVDAVVDTAGAPIDADALLRWARERLGARAPVVIRVVDHPVRDDAGKTRRRYWAAAAARDSAPGG